MCAVVFFGGGCSSAVESWIVIPVVVGSNPISHPNLSAVFRSFYTHASVNALASFFLMTQQSRKLVAGNWKMNGSLAVNRELIAALLPGLDGVAGADVAVCAPFVYLSQLQPLLAATRVALGAQTVSEYGSGAYTGEVSGVMLKEMGCAQVIVGHSERRALFGETSLQAAAKFAAALKAGLQPILCVGETLAEREAGATEAVVGAQLDAVLDQLGAAALGQGVVAYEPVWAIGTGKTASPEQAQAVHGFIRARIARRDAAVALGVKILYGGSVKAANAKTLFACADIDGGLVGGASLQAQEFVAICQAAG